MPGFVTASATDPKWNELFEMMERSFGHLERMADEDPAILDIFDKMQAAIGRADLSLKQRLVEVVRIFTELRDTIKIVH